jgi:NTP pyrophosphatase (non-canonical NTP hydrolase)
MTGNEYQTQAMRTNDGHAQDRLTDRLLAGIMRKKDVAGLINGLMGLTGEAGELTDLFKKWIFHNAPLDEQHAKKEVGDVLWYVAMICHSMGWNMDEIMQMNIEKLKARYPEGFDTEKSNHRKEGDI